MRCEGSTTGPWSASRGTQRGSRRVWHRCSSVTEYHELRPTPHRCRTRRVRPAGRASRIFGCTARRGRTGRAMTRTLSRHLAATIGRLSTAEQVWCVFDNTASGAAIENAWELRERVSVDSLLGDEWRRAGLFSPDLVGGLSAGSTTLKGARNSARSHANQIAERASSQSQTEPKGEAFRTPRSARRRFVRHCRGRSDLARRPSDLSGPRDVED